MISIKEKNVVFEYVVRYAYSINCHTKNYFARTALEIKSSVGKTHRNVWINET
jgi:hypothetical protein